MIETALSELLSDIRNLQIVRSSLEPLVDGLGINRVIETLTPTPVTKLTLRRANSADVLSYFSWVNDPMVRSMALKTEPINLNTHLAWFEKRLSDANTFLYILEARGLPVGQVRFECHNEEAIIDYSLDEFVRGRGWANKLLRLGIAAFISHKQIQLKATVKQSNITSSATFIGLGFIEQKVSKEDENRHFQLSIQALKIEASKSEKGIRHE